MKKDTKESGRRLSHACARGGRNKGAWKQALSPVYTPLYAPKSSLAGGPDTVSRERTAVLILESPVELKQGHASGGLQEATHRSPTLTADSALARDERKQADRDTELYLFTLPVNIPLTSSLTPCSLPQKRQGQLSRARQQLLHGWKERSNNRRNAAGLPTCVCPLSMLLYLTDVEYLQYFVDYLHYLFFFFFNLPPPRLPRLRLMPSE